MLITINLYWISILEIVFFEYLLLYRKYKLAMVGRPPFRRPPIQVIAITFVLLIQQICGCYNWPLWIVQGSISLFGRPPIKLELRPPTGRSPGAKCPGSRCISIGRRIISRLFYFVSISLFNTRDRVDWSSWCHHKVPECLRLAGIITMFWGGLLSLYMCDNIEVDRQHTIDLIQVQAHLNSLRNAPRLGVLRHANHRPPTRKDSPVGNPPPQTPSSAS